MSVHSLTDAHEPESGAVRLLMDVESFSIVLNPHHDPFGFIRKVDIDHLGLCVAYGIHHGFLTDTHHIHSSRGLQFARRAMNPQLYLSWSDLSGTLHVLCDR